MQALRDVALIAFVVAVLMMPNAVFTNIVADIRAMLTAHPDIDATQTLIVNFTQFGASSLDLMVYAFTKTVVWVAYQEVKQDVLLNIGRIVAQHGAQVAFPTQSLHFSQP